MPFDQIAIVRIVIITWYSKNTKWLEALSLQCIQKISYTQLKGHHYSVCYQAALLSYLCSCQSLTYFIDWIEFLMMMIMISHRHYETNTLRSHCSIPMNQRGFDPRWNPQETFQSGWSTCAWHFTWTLSLKTQTCAAELVKECDVLLLDIWLQEFEWICNWIHATKFDAIRLSR